jgi:hypothetical protein
LHQRQTIDQQSNIVAVFVFAFDGNLVRNLKLVLAPMLGLYKFKISTDRLKFQQKKGL